MEPIASKVNYWEDAIYLCSVDIEQKKKLKLGNIELYIPTEYNRNHRTSHPNYGIIEAIGGDAEFKVGDGLLVTHFTFEGEDRKKKVFYKEGVKEYYRAINFDVMFGVVDGELIPRKYNLLCEAVEGKFVDTMLTLSTNYEGKRRDLVRVLKTWKGCELYKEGDLLLIETNGDYGFEWEGKEYIKVDHYFGDVLAIVPSEKWYKEEVNLHHNDHYTMINPMDR